MKGTLVKLRAINRRTEAHMKLNEEVRPLHDVAAPAVRKYFYLFCEVGPFGSRIARFRAFIHQPTKLKRFLARREGRGGTSIGASYNYRSSIYNKRYIWALGRLIYSLSWKTGRFRSKSERVAPRAARRRGDSCGCSWRTGKQSSRHAIGR